MLRGLALVFVIAISVAIFSLPEDLAERLKDFGYPGIFLLSLLTNATLVLPAPGLLLVFSFGARFAPFGVALAAAAGATVGEVSGYLAGFSGQAVVERSERMQQLEGWMKKNGPLTIAILACIPNPLFDFAGILAGALKMPLPTFMFWVFWGKLVKMLIVAYAGAGILNLPVF